MNFWATRLAGAPPQASVEAPVVPVQVQGAWFSNPLLNGQQQPAQQAPPQEVFVPSRDGTVVKTKKPLASRNAGTCPECGGGNYGRTGPSNNYERCFECGYNSRFEQAMAGAGIPSGAAPAAPTVQVASGGGKGSINNFHPDIIVARLSD